MKKLLCLAALVSAASLTTANAADAKGNTLEQFLAASKAKAEKAGNKFNKKGKTEQFKAMDANNDGIVTGKESKAFFKSKKKK